MNIAVLNFSPNVGKTTIAKNLLLPRLPLSYVAIESIHDNADIHKKDDIIKRVENQVSSMPSLKTANEELNKSSNLNKLLLQSMI